MAWNCMALIHSQNHCPTIVFIHMHIDDKFNEICFLCVFVCLCICVCMTICVCVYSCVFLLLNIWRVCFQFPLHCRHTHVCVCVLCIMFCVVILIFAGVQFVLCISQIWIEHKTKRTDKKKKTRQNNDNQITKHAKTLCCHG